MVEVAPALSVNTLFLCPSCCLACFYCFYFYLFTHAAPARYEIMTGVRRLSEPTCRGPEGSRGRLDPINDGPPIGRPSPGWRSALRWGRLTRVDSPCRRRSEPRSNEAREEEAPRGASLCNGVTFCEASRAGGGRSQQMCGIMSEGPHADSGRDANES